MGIFEAILLGIVEGITEFLPISSTGHLILASSLLGIPQTDFSKTFDIAIQLGAIGAVLLLYWRSFLDFGLLKRLAAAFLPTAIIGFLAYGLVKEHLLGNESVVLASLFIGGLILIFFDRAPAHSSGGASEITYRQALLLGLFQAAALVPGVSRSGATIMGGVLLGISRAAVVEFSFLLAVPTMLAATTLSLYGSSASFSQSDWAVLAIGFVTAFLVALPVVRWLLHYARTHSFRNFGIYRIVLAVAFAAFLFLR